MNAPAPRTSAGTWLLRIFLGSFLIAVAAPVALALAVLTLSADTRALRNAAVTGDGAQWRKKVEFSVGSVPFTIARMALPFVNVPEEARQAFSAVRSVEVSVHELRSSEPNRARILEEADRRMTKRGWDRIVAVIEGDTMVAVYVLPDAETSDVKFATLVLEDRQMVAVTGRGNVKPLFDLAMQKAGDEFLAKHKRDAPALAKATDHDFLVQRPK